MIPLKVAFYARGDAGVPGTKLMPFPYRPTSYQHTIVARGGFESMTVVYTVPADVALDWLANNLMATVFVSDPDGALVWEGFIAQISVVFGQEQRAVSLDGMANRVRCKYTTVLDTPGTTAASSDTASQALYGVKDAVLSVGKTISTAAANLVARYLREHKNPKMTPQTQASTGTAAYVEMTVQCAGWYTALDWLVTSNTSTTNTSTTTQVTTLLGTYNSTNNFFSTSTINVTASGITDTEYMEADTTYKQKIEALLAQGNSSGEALAWGIYDGRIMTIAQWAGADPTAITYRRSQRDSTIRDDSQGVVQPWNVRPDAIYQVQELLDISPVSTAQDAAARFYVSRVTCTVSSEAVGITLEPADYSGADAVLARLSR